MNNFAIFLSGSFAIVFAMAGAGKAYMVGWGMTAMAWGSSLGAISCLFLSVAVGLWQLATIRKHLERLDS